MPDVRLLRFVPRRPGISSVSSRVPSETPAAPLQTSPASPNEIHEKGISPSRVLRMLANAVSGLRGMGLTMFLASRVLAAEADADVLPPTTDAVATTLEELNQADWAIGSTARGDVIAPVAFSAADPDTTARLQTQAASEVTPIFRFVTVVANEALRDLDAKLADSRRTFQEAVARTFGPLPLDAKAFLGDDFQNFCSAWALEHRGTVFPPTSLLARAWATKSDDTALLHPWRRVLQAMLSENRLCDLDSEGATDESSPVLRLVRVAKRDEALTPEVVARRAALIDRGQLWTVPEARELFRQRQPAQEQAAAAFIGAFLRPNTFSEWALTQHERDDRARLVTAPPQNYPAGAVIIREGEVITAAVAAAMAGLREKLATIPIRAPAVAVAVADEAAAPQLVTAPSTPPAPPPLPRPAEHFPAWINRAFLIGVPISLGAVALAIVWMTSRLSRRSTRLAASAESKTPESPVVLALRDTTVQHLYSHRQELLAHQDRSSDQVSALELRVARLQPQMQARIRAYEVRIKELESRLAGKEGAATTNVHREIERLRKERETRFPGDPDDDGRREGG